MTADFSGINPAQAAAMRTMAQLNASAIGVRIAALPPDLQNNPQPLRLNGTVIGQSQDGSVQVQTERGVVSLMLRDGHALKPGQNLQIDIPAGRPPQQANISARPQQQAQSPQTPSLAGSVSTPATTISPDLPLASTVKPDIAQALTPQGLTIKPGVPITLQAGQQIALVPLQAQTTAVPLSGASITLPGVAQVQGQLQTAMSPEQFLTMILQTLQSLPKTEAVLRTAILQLLAKSALDLPTLLKADTKGNPALEQLQTQLKSLISAGDLPKPQNLPTGPASQWPLLQKLPSQSDGFTARVLGFIGNPSAMPVSGQTMPAQNMVAVSPAVMNAMAPPQTSSTAPATPFLILQMVGMTSDRLPMFSPLLPFPSMPGQSSPLFALPQQVGNIAPGSPMFLVVDAESGDIAATVLPRSQTIPLTQSTTLPMNTLLGDLPDFFKPGLWTGLNDILQQAIRTGNMQLASLLMGILPNTAQPQQAAAATLFFLAALRSGDMKSWAGNDAFAALQASGEEPILQLLSRDIHAAARTQSAAPGDAGSQDWKATFMPFLDSADQQIHRLPLYYKEWSDENKPDKDKDRRNKMLRFLFDLKLTRMGKVQVDGYMEDQRLDLILRTETVLSAQMQQSMRGMYKKAVEKSNLTGDLNFQTRLDQWMIFDIIPEPEMVGL